jgi:hypothetical protein
VNTASLVSVQSAACRFTLQAIGNGGQRYHVVPIVIRITFVRAQPLGGEKKVINRGALACFDRTRLNVSFNSFGGHDASVTHYKGGCS